ncbi:pyridoxal-phosphate dependent enzyme [Spirillospora sp. CA-294931]|uniref:pyridoxal-phosphate dependent enzyme n=1 Tax=Spirillospora sp. CA-294931 TaxID=3240042 RepID=UPI003D906123
MNLVPPPADLSGLTLRKYPGGPWGWPDALPVGGGGGLGEGCTPCVALDGGLWLKDETRNPTGTHKDRAMSVSVAAAVASGASTVVAASSGNAGVAAAAYAARAGLECVVLTGTSIPPVPAARIRAHGARLRAYPDARTRNRMMEAAVTELGWYPLTNYVLPVAGDNPYGCEGYKSIAYELARDLGSDLDAIVVPTCKADVLAGIARGYRELAKAGLVERVPRLVAAETATAAAFTAALSLPDRPAQERVSIEPAPSPAFSIGAATPSWQGLDALWSTGGEAIAVDVDEYMTESRRLAASAGLFLEAASAVAVAAARRLDARRVVALGTGGGVTGLTADALREPDEAPADLDALL